MKRRIPSFTRSIVVGSQTGPGSVAVRRFAEQWEQGAPISTEEYLARHPDLAANAALHLEVAYEEYCQRTSAGQLVDAVAFCQRFPALEGSLEQLLLVHRYLQDDDWESLPNDEVPWPEPGETFQGFELRREVGRGTFARVFLANEPAVGDRQVAVKVSLDGHSEATTLGRLHHDNIVLVHSAQKDEATGLTAICMPYHGAVTLQDVLRKLHAGGRRPLSGREILEVCRPANSDAPAPARPLRRGSYVDAAVHLAVHLADALAHAHAAGICHRDLKPSNVLIDAAGRPLLLDFNLSSDPQASDRRDGGTLPYMPPEQIRGTFLDRAEAPLPDARSDVYSLGVLLYEMLCGQAPFGNPADVSTTVSLKAAAEELIRRQQSRPRPLRSLNPHVNARLARLVERCLAPNPDDRPATAARLAADLRRANPPQARAGRWMGMHKALATAAAACLLFGVLAVSAGVASREPEYVRKYNAGVAAAAEGDFEQAVQLFKEATDRNPEYYDAWMARGKAHLKLDRWNSAVNDFDAAINVRPQEANAHAAKGYAYIRQESPLPALFCLRDAVAIEWTPESMNNCAVACRLVQPTPDIKRARDLLDEAAERWPDLSIVRYNRFLVELVAASMENRPIDPKAIPDILAAANGDPNNARLRYLAAVGYVKSQNPDFRQARLELEAAASRGWNPSELTENGTLKALRSAPDFDVWYSSLLKEYVADTPAEWRASPPDLIDPSNDAPW